MRPEGEGLQKDLKAPVSPQVKIVGLGLEGSGAQVCISEIHNFNGSALLCVVHVVKPLLPVQSLWTTPNLHPVTSKHTYTCRHTHLQRDAHTHTSPATLKLL